MCGFGMGFLVVLVVCCGDSFLFDAVKGKVSTVNSY